MSEFQQNSQTLGKVHNAANQKKYYCYYTGFIEGIIASGYVEAKEIEPLIVQSREFVVNTSDIDASDIIADFECELLEFEALVDIAAYRENKIDASCKKSSINRFLGFCAGISCDGKITEEEASELVRRVECSDFLSDDPCVRAILVSCRDALQDGVVSEDESQEICYWISRIAGDSYADTGLTSISNTPVFDEHRIQDFPAEIEGAPIVFTGSFQTSPRRELEDLLAQEGARITKTVTRKTAFLIIGGEASRDWIETNRGTKLLKALSLIQDGNGPKLVSEGQLRRLLAL